jgi:beta-glucosidase
VPQGYSFGFEPASAGQVKGVDRRAQEDSRRFTWPGGAPATVVLQSTPPLDLSRETTGQLSLVVDYRVDSPPTAPVTLAAASAALPITGLLRSAPVGQWTTLTIPLGCFAKAGADMSKLTRPVAITTAGSLTMTISDIRVLSATVPQDRCGAQ